MKTEQEKLNYSTFNDDISSSTAESLALRFGNGKNENVLLRRKQTQNVTEIHSSVKRKTLCSFIDFSITFSFSLAQFLWRIHKNSFGIEIDVADIKVDIIYFIFEPEQTK